MSIASKLLQLNQVKQNIKTAIETKGVPLTNVAFTEYANKILDISGGGWDISYEEYALVLYYRFGKLAVFENAWEHSLTVDPEEISANGTTSNNRGKAQYPNGETEGVIIPHSVTSIGRYAFYKWSSNNQPLVIPDSVTSIENSAFGYWQENNQPLVIPDSVTSIGSSAFLTWKANTHPLVIPNSVTSIGNDVFSYWNSNNQPLVIPDSVTSIGSSAFLNWTSNNQPLVIPDSVTSIETYAFYKWSSNNQPLVIPNSVTSIGNAAFGYWEANNQPLVIPDSVTSIGTYAFNNWSLVPYIEMQAIVPPSISSSTAFGNQNNAPIYVPDESVDDYKTATNWVNLASRIFSINDK